jgi:hypothetical protein
MNMFHIPKLAWFIVAPEGLLLFPSISDCIARLKNNRKSAGGINKSVYVISCHKLWNATVVFGT